MAFLQYHQSIPDLDGEIDLDGALCKVTCWKNGQGLAFTIATDLRGVSLCRCRLSFNGKSRACFADMSRGGILITLNSFAINVSRNSSLCLAAAASTAMELRPC